MSLVKLILTHYEKDYRAERHTKSTLAIIAVSIALIILALVMASRDYTDVYFQKASVHLKGHSKFSIQFPITANWSQHITVGKPVIVIDNSGSKHRLAINRIDVQSGQLFAYVKCNVCNFTQGQNTDVRVIAGNSSLISTFVDGLR